MSSLDSFSRKGWVVLFVFVVTQIVYLAMVLVTLPHLRSLAGGLEPFDLLPGGYDMDYARRLLEAIGSEGRAFYLTRQIPLDLLYPGLFAATFAMVWLWLFARLSSPSPLLRAGALLPIVVGIADYAENALVVTMLIGFPNLSKGVVKAASLFTVTKSMATVLYFVALLCLLAVVGVRRYRAGRP
ncbi:MAG: hypothetical protein HKM95_06255 [Inquilinus sp.]|nr:hypothetical protein [Inquilinus sp.]